MADSKLQSLATLELEADVREAIGLAPGPLRLARAWPRGAYHLLLEYKALDGATVAGQWFGDYSHLLAVASETANLCKAPSAVVPGTGVLLQPGGADRRLPGLAPMLTRDGATLIVHRPERRAVVRLREPDGERFVKVVRPDRAHGVATAGRAAEQLGGRHFATPRLLELDLAGGSVTWSGLTGTSLHELASEARFVRASLLAGRALRALHDMHPPAEAATHSARDEIAWLELCLDRLRTFVPGLAASLLRVAPAVFGALDQSTSAPVLLHRDFHDKQVLVDSAGNIGILDFDTLGVGEAALDVANALVHFELRALQGLCSGGQAAEAVAAFLEGYGADRGVLRRLPAYVDATRLRLAYLYALRPTWTGTVPAALLESLDASQPARSA